MKDLRDKGKMVEAVFYDNACKLLAVARAKQHLFPPYTDLSAQLKILLDQFHRNNHVWCLKNLPEVDCQSEPNKKWVDGVNSQACEDMNSFINDRTVPSLEMTKGLYYVYWYALFRLKNERTTEQRALARQRFVRGHIRQDPDKVVQKLKRRQVRSRAKI